MSFRKGSPRHALAGKIFVIAMMTMSSSAVYLAFMKHQMGNVLGGTLDCAIGFDSRGRGQAVRCITAEIIRRRQRSSPGSHGRYVERARAAFDLRHSIEQIRMILSRPLTQDY